MLIGMAKSEEVVSTTAPLGPHRSATPELHATYTTLEIIVALIAVVGNAMVIHVFCRDRRLRRRTNYYIVSLAVADLLVGLLGIPFAILASVGLPRNLHACLFTVSLLVMLCTISIFCLVGVSVDRYWAILHPMCYSRNVRTKTAIVPKVSARGGHGGGHGHSSGGHHSGGRGRFGGLFGKSRSSHVSATHAYYSYHPPQQMRYVCSHCNGPTNYPVFHGQPPTYVYKYRESGSRFGDLLSGLALYNLGRASNDHTPYNNYYHQQNTYEECSMQVIDRTHFEETKVPCFMVSTFMERAAAEPQGPQDNQMDISTAHVDVNQFLNDTGTPVEVTSNQECVIWHNTTMNRERNQVPCALLKRYADTLKHSGVPVYIWFPSLLIAVMAVLIMCQCCYRRKKDKMESVPLNEGTVLGYSSYCP